MIEKARTQSVLAIGAGQLTTGIVVMMELLLQPVIIVIITLLFIAYRIIPKMLGGESRYGKNDNSATQGKRSSQACVI